MRPIDADALKRKAQKVATESWKMKLTAKVETVMNQFMDWIEEAPTIEQETTEWIEDGDDFNFGELTKRWKCGRCGFFCFGNSYPNMHYCPNCGRKVKWHEGDDE